MTICSTGGGSWGAVDAPGADSATAPKRRTGGRTTSARRDREVGRGVPSLRGAFMNRGRKEDVNERTRE
jgi:hypothetical protein